MKFVIEALGLTSGGGRAGTLRLLPALASHEEHSFVALLADLPEFACLQRRNLRPILQKKPGSLLAREIYLQHSVPRICERERADALLCLGNFGPRRSAVPTIVMLHNPHYVAVDAGARIKLTMRERFLRRYGRRYVQRLPDAARLVVQTELMKQRVLCAAGVSPSRVVVIHDADALPPGADAMNGDCCGASQSEPREVRDEATCRRSPFTFLCLTQYYPHKNLEVLIEAVKRLPAHTRRPARCLLTIHPGQHPGARRLLRRIEHEHLDTMLVNIGPVPGERLGDVYRSADAFVLPTLLESFGRTYLEAMRFGLPIATSDRDFARHLCGEAAIYFDPLDPASVAENMGRIIEDRELAAQLTVEGGRIVQRIPTWEKIADQFLAVLEEAGREGASRVIRPLFHRTVESE